MLRLPPRDREPQQSSALPQVLLWACKVARHAALCRRLQLRLSLPSQVSSLKLSEVTRRPSPRSTRHTSSPHEGRTPTHKLMMMINGFYSQNGRWPNPKCSRQKGGTGYFPIYSMTYRLLDRLLVAEEDV